MTKKQEYVSRSVMSGISECNKKIVMLTQLTGMEFKSQEKLLKKAAKVWFVGSELMSVNLNLSLVLKEEGFDSWEDLETFLKRGQND